MRRFLLAPISPLARFLRLTAAACLFLMMLLSVIDVIGRYFMRPLFGATEMIQLLLAITIFAAIGLTSLARGHVTVDILEPIIDRYAARPRRRLVQFASLLTFAMIVHQLSRIALTSAATERRTLVLEWPVAWAIGLCAIFMLAAFWIELATPRPNHSNDDPANASEENRS